MTQAITEKQALKKQQEAGKLFLKRARLVMEIGFWFKEFRDRRLYLGRFKTFDDYCQKVWGKTRAEVYGLINAAPRLKLDLFEGEGVAPESIAQIGRDGERHV